MPKGLNFTHPEKGELKPYDPSWRDKIAWALSDALGGGDRGRTNYINSRARGAVDFAPGVGDAVGLNDAKRDFDAGNYGSAAVGAGTSLVGMVPGLGDLAAAGLKAGGSALGMLMGPMSKTWRGDMAKKSLDMFGEGKDLDSIWKETGTTIGKDLNLRQEIPGILNVTGKYGTLEDSVDFPQLFEAYPHLKSTAVDPELNPGFLGSFNPTTGALSMSSEALGDPDVWAHELQHSIQGKEGFDGGINPEFLRKRFAWEDSLPGIFRDAALSKSKGKMPVADAENAALFEIYNRSSGEAEARNAATRMRNPESKSMAPYLTADRAMNEQLIAPAVTFGVFDKNHGLNKNLRGIVKPDGSDYQPPKIRKMLDVFGHDLVYSRDTKKLKKLSERKW